MSWGNAEKEKAAYVAAYRAGMKSAENLIEIPVPAGIRFVSLWSLNQNNMLFPVYEMDVEKHIGTGFTGQLFQLRFTGHNSQFAETLPSADLVSTPQADDPLQETNDLTGGSPALGKESDDLIVTFFS